MPSVFEAAHTHTDISVFISYLGFLGAKGNNIRTRHTWSKPSLSRHRNIAPSANTLPTSVTGSESRVDGGVIFEASKVAVWRRLKRCWELFVYPAGLLLKYH